MAPLAFAKGAKITTNNQPKISKPGYDEIMIWAISGIALCALQQIPVEGELGLGDKAPDFTLKMLARNEWFTLSSNFGHGPTILIFGSYT